MFISNAGNVGIGNTSPTHKLDIGSGSAAADLYLYGNVSGSLNSWVRMMDRSGTSVGFAAAVGGTQTLNLEGGSGSSYFNGGGNLGIGTTTPAARLSVTNAVSSAQTMIAYDNSRAATFQVDTAGDLYIAASGQNIRTSDGNLYVCSGGSCPSGSVSGTGNIVAETKIGVGSSTPWAAVSVSNGSIVSAEYQNTDAATITVSFNNGNQQRVTLGGNRTINFSNYIPGQLLRLIVCQDGTGSRTVTWDSSLTWSSATAPTLTTTANKCDVISIFGTSATGTLRLFGSSVTSF
jgi:hypothetical protein